MENTDTTPATQAANGDQKERVTVTILLDGGYRYSLSLARDASLLGQLIGTLTLPPDQRANALFQIPISQELGSLTFSGDRLTGVLTNPPILVRKKEAETPEAA
jgi:SM-20-related protein